MNDEHILRLQDGVTAVEFAEALGVLLDYNSDEKQDFRGEPGHIYEYMWTLIRATGCASEWDSPDLIRDEVRLGEHREGDLHFTWRGPVAVAEEQAHEAFKKCMGDVRRTQSGSSGKNWHSHELWVERPDAQRERDTALLDDVAKSIGVEIVGIEFCRTERGEAHIDRATGDAYWDGVEVWRKEQRS